MSKQDPGHLYDEPLDVRTCGDAVVVLGPDAVAISITADAAERSARALQIAAKQVRARMAGRPLD
jgi:hypothetical protein